MCARTLADKGRSPGGRATSMGALAAYLARQLDVRLGHVVSALARSAGDWSLTIAGGADEEARLHHADALVMAVPAPQCAALLAPVSKLHREVAAVEQTPCWAVMAAVRGATNVDADLSGRCTRRRRGRWLTSRTPPRA